MSEEHGEPWQEANGGDSIVNTDGMVADASTPYEHYFNSEYARRIVACVNACAGTSTVDLEQLPLVDLRTLVAYETGFHDGFDEARETYEEAS